MDIPDHYLRRPSAWRATDVVEFERLYSEQVSAGTGAPIRYRPAAPKWQFLCWMTESKDVVLHGANASTVDVLEPRQAKDINEFGARNAIYAASDGLWPMYFAVVNRSAVTSLVNACVHLTDDGVELGTAYYYFSIGHDDDATQLWMPGTVYVLPSGTFEPEPEDTWLGRPCAPTQWLSPIQVSPLARLDVVPDDFPFLNQVRSHDREVVAERAAQNPDNFPWLNQN